MFFPPRQKPPKQVQDRAGISFLFIDCQGQMCRRDRQPWLGGSETSIRQLGRPWHRCSTPVATLEIGPELDTPWVAQIGESDVGLSQTKFFALVDTSPSPKRQQCSQQQLGQSGL